MHELDHPQAGGIVPLVAIAVFLALLTVYPLAARLTAGFTLTDENLINTTTVSRIKLAALSVAAQTTFNNDGKLTAPSAALNGVPEGMANFANDAFGTPFSYCPSGKDYQSANEPLFALISAGRNRQLETPCLAALTGSPSGDDIVDVTNAFSAASMPHQIQPVLPRINEMWLSQCETTGVIQNIDPTSKCSSFDQLWADFSSTNTGFFYQ